MLQRLRAAWVRLFGSGRAGESVTAELESHVELATEDGVRRGLSRAEARRRALIGLGGAEQTRQAYRDRATLPWLEDLKRDVGYALRGFGRNPIFTVTVIVTLALGLGTTTAVFSVVDRILFRSLPYAHADRLVSFGLSQSLEKQEFTLGGFFFTWRDSQRPFEEVTYERGVEECNLTEGNPLHLECGRVAANFLSTLGVPLVLGRSFLPEEDVPNGPRVAILSDALWLSRFNRDRTVLNRSIEIDDHAYRIVGILPRGFEMPRLQPVDILSPAQVDIAAQHTENLGIGVPLWAFARLKPGVSMAEAREEMQPLFLATQNWIPPQIRKDFHLAVRSIRDRQMQDAYAAARILLGAVIAVLLIACANVASLLSARRVARERELAVRSALGASRWRLVRQAATEALLLGMAGAVSGCLLAAVLLRVFIAIAPTGLPFLEHATIDLRIIFFAVAVALSCALVFGAVQAIESPRAEALVARATLSQAHVRLRRALVAAQIATSLVLLVGAMLLVKSFRNLENQKLGMATRDVVALHLPLTAQRYPTAQALMDFYLRVEGGLRHVPGITAVSVSDSIPPDASSWHDGRRYSDLYANGKPAAAAGVGGSIVLRRVTPDYFHVLRIPLLEGRDFLEEERTTDTNPAILSRLLAARLFPGQNPIGQHFQYASYLPYFALAKTVYTVVGVAGEVKNGGLAGVDLPELYELRRDRAADWGAHEVVLVETELPAATLAPWIHSTVAGIDPSVPVEMVPLARSVDQLADRPRFEMALVSFFALTGLVMAAIGLYGVIAYVATQRTQEIGLRMALGATRIDILRLIAAEGVRLIVAGGVLGLIAALAAARLLESLLFAVEPHDPGSFLAVALFLALVALVATLLPARSAMKTDPMSALRSE